MPQCCGVVIVFARPRDWTPGRGGRPLYMPVERATPERPGKLAVWVGADQRVRCRVLRAGEQPGAGGHLGVSHFAHCADADRHRRRGQVIACRR